MGEQLVKRAAPLHFAPKDIHRHPVADIGLALHHRQRWGRMVAVQHRRQTDHPFPPNRGDFHHAAVLQHGQDGAESAAREIHVLNDFVRLVNRTLQFERDRLERGGKARVVGWKGREQLVGWRSSDRGRCGRTALHHDSRSARPRTGPCMSCREPGSALFRARQAGDSGRKTYRHSITVIARKPSIMRLCPRTAGAVEPPTSADERRVSLRKRPAPARLRQMRPKWPDHLGRRSCHRGLPRC